MRTAVIHPGTVKARAINQPAPGPDHVFTVVVHLPDKDVTVENVRPWVLPFTRNGVLIEPYPLSAPVQVHEVGTNWYFVFPNIFPFTEVCG